MVRTLLVVVAVVAGLAILTMLMIGIGQPGEEIKCPYCGSTVVWTPIGSRSENFLWRCLVCGKTWTKSYPERLYSAWREGLPGMLRDVAVGFVRSNHRDAAELMPAEFKWTVRVCEGNKYVYESDGWVVEVVLTYKPGFEASLTVDYSSSRREGWIGIPHRIIWKGVFRGGEVVELDYLHAV